MVIKEATLRKAIRSELKKLVMEVHKNGLLEQDEKDVKIKSASQFKADMMASLEAIDLPAARLEGVSELMKALMEKIAEPDTATLGKIATLLNVDWKTGEEKK